METEFITARQASARLQIPSRVIRAYCNGGLIKHVRHNKFGRRIFTASQLDQLALLYGLRQAGFSQPQLKQYVEAKDRQAKKSLLSTQKRQLWQELEDIQSSIDFIERQEELLS